MSWAALTLLCACQRAPEAPPKKSARPLRELVGNHRAEAACAEGPATLRLATGLRAEVCRGKAPGAALLAIAPTRLGAAGLAPGFLPIGPSFVLDAPDAELGCSWTAENYQVRAGYRVVLAVRADVVLLHEARYDDARFRARVPRAPGATMQFGLVPDVVSAPDAQVSRSAAP